MAERRWTKLFPRTPISPIQMAAGFGKRWLPGQNQDQLSPPGLEDSNNVDIGSALSDSDHPASIEPKDDLKNPIVEVGEEKAVPGSTTPSFNEGWADDHPAIKDIPYSVRRIVSLEDDPTLPTLTFRYFLLTILFVLPGAFLSQMSHFRTTSAPYSVFFVQIAANYVGIWLAKVLPAWIVKVPFTKYGFNLNPGPWSVKEHVLVTISAASGATYNLAYAPVSIAELYFNQKMNAGVAIVFMWAVVWTGYSFAAISRQFLLYDPQYPWSVPYPHPTFCSLADVFKGSKRCARPPSLKLRRSSESNLQPRRENRWSSSSLCLPP